MSIPGAGVPSLQEIGPIGPNSSSSNLLGPGSVGIRSKHPFLMETIVTWEFSEHAVLNVFGCFSMGLMTIPIWQEESLLHPIVLVG